jgi:ABC-2 type transport system permease protein
VKNLNGIKAEFVSTLDTIATPGIRKTILLKSSKYSQVLSTPHEINLSIINRPPNQQMYNHSYEPVAVLLEGRFPSAFANIIPPEIKNSVEMGFRDKSDSTQMLVVSDGDIIKNAISTKRGEVKALPLGVDKYTGQRYGNEDFIVNAVNYLCDDSGLLNVRTRDLKIRLLNKPKVKKEKTQWQIINVVLPVLIILLISMTWNIIRKKKYRRTKP